MSLICVYDVSCWPGCRTGYRTGSRDFSGGKVKSSSRAAQQPPELVTDSDDPVPESVQGQQPLGVEGDAEEEISQGK